MHFLENSMFVLNAYFCRELRFVEILRSKLRFLLRNSGVDSDFTQNFWGKNWRLKALLEGWLLSSVQLPQQLQNMYSIHCIPDKLESSCWPCPAISLGLRSLPTSLIISGRRACDIAWSTAVSPQYNRYCGTEAVGVTLNTVDGFLYQSHDIHISKRSLVRIFNNQSHANHISTTRVNHWQGQAQIRLESYKNARCLKHSDSSSSVTSSSSSLRPPSLTASNSSVLT